LKDASVQNAYPEAWRAYRIRALTRNIALIAFFPIGVLVGVPLSKAFNSEALPMIMAGCLMAVIIFGNVLVVFWRCPRCDNLFHVRPSGYVNPFAHTCGYCNLPKVAGHTGTG